LIRNDIVTCVRYYKNRINALQQLISHDYKYYGELKDHFFVTEFQNRGSQHDHALLWIKDAPIYGRNTNVEIEDFVDIYLSCDSRILGNDLKTIQHHHHTRTCTKNKNTHCRFNFPIPPMRKTRILEPTKFHDDTTKKNAKLNFDTLEHAKYNETYTFDNFLQGLSLSNEDYINAIKCSLNQTTILL
jgi:chromosomal replication initiation ATPase DnaA